MPVNFKTNKETKSLLVDSPFFRLDNAVFPYVWLRDACQAPHSVHPGTKQKLFQTSDIDPDIEPVSVVFDKDSESLRIVWDRGFLKKPDAPAERESVLPIDILRKHQSWRDWREDNFESSMAVTWDRQKLGPWLAVLFAEHLN
jgi:hypothetical protein